MSDYRLLDTPIEYLKGVGPQRAAILKKELDIHTYIDLLQYYPFRYVDKTKFYKINELYEELPYVQFVGRIISKELIGANRTQRLVVWVHDNTGKIELVWFQGIKWIKDKIQIGSDYVIFGKVSVFNGKKNIAHPEIEDYSEFTQSRPSKLQSVYNSSEKLKIRGLDTKGISKLLKILVPLINGSIPENLNFDIIQSLRFLSRQESFKQIHFPDSPQQLVQARNRLKFEELFYIQLDLLKVKKEREINEKGFIFGKVGSYFNDFFYKNLPFELTNAQKRVIKEIRVDIGSGKQMNRLLQGDVGSGKTLVALMSMLIALDCGFQACIMAPTEILAKQHFETFSSLLSGLSINIAIITGSSKTAEKKKVLKSLLDGECQIVIGTHALIEKTVEFKNLGFVVIDEQHKFGVAQRAKLWSKNNQAPHVLVMTATPIPRTLAMTFYGDLDTSVIDELPPGRKPIMTLHKMENERFRVIHFMKEQISLGRQIYIVFPLINESETLDLKDLNEGYENLLVDFPLQKYGISVVHGQMKAIDKEIEMKRFLENKSQIMVATTVIEVGVNVPNASVMIIENAERFGLSQLHQLRGRVGRGADQSYCILMTKQKLGFEAKKRTSTMVATNDGFKIAEVDLQLRGPGDVAGTQQSGNTQFLIADLKKDYQILSVARKMASEIIDKDPNLLLPENLVLKNNLIRFRRTKEDWSKIS
ncbi:MAG: ATP-dependent DNA helicase RecG [Bacteroidota bacterium]